MRKEHLPDEPLNDFRIWQDTKGYHLQQTYKTNYYKPIPPWYGIGVYYEDYNYEYKTIKCFKTLKQAKKAKDKELIKLGKIVG